ncbi:MAG: hypothetical protein KatS3mg076_0108 [Candidatus Binatia bacterium]|nr:MAG: hypothetical protein KatS3mg076_0108 [Candidatus Binatia bacterium]
MCVTGPGKRLFVAAGTYSAETTGEVFPLIVRGHAVEGRPDGGAVTVIGLGPSADGDVTFLVEPAGSLNQLKDLEIVSPSSGAGTGILVRDGATSSDTLVQGVGVSDFGTGLVATGGAKLVSVSSGDFVGNGTGIRTEGNVLAQLTANRIENGGSGLRILGSSVVQVRSNTIRDNSAQNVEVESSGADLGAVGAPGNNTIQGAGGVNIWNRSGGTVPAVGNTLDAGRLTDQANEDETDPAHNIANEPGGCIELSGSDCP